jgi:cysteine-S-conjugate beta-lyase
VSPSDEILPHSKDLERLRSLTCIKWRRYGPEVLPAWVADMDLPTAPAVSEAVSALVERGDFGYNFSAAAGIPDAFIAWQEARNGWKPERTRTRLLCDVMQGVDLTLHLHTKPGDGVVVFTPIYPPFLSSVNGNGRRIVDCPLDPDGWRLDPERLASVIDERTTAILMCDPHNPTGRAFTRAELEAVAEVAERHDLLVISDEIWGDLTYAPAIHLPFATISDEAAARTVTITAASKSFSIAGLHCAVANFGHDGVFEAMKALPSHLLGAVGSPGGEATLAAWTCGGEWLDKTRAFLLTQRDHVAARLSAELPEVGFTVPDATYLAWLDFRPLELGVDPATFLLENARVGLSTGPDFGEEGVGFTRLNFATTRPILDEILDRMVAAVRER